MYAESVRVRASAAKHWCMHEVFIKSGFFLRITACVEVISRSPTWPSAQAGCPVWQLEIISFISYFALVTHITAKTQTRIHTPKVQMRLHTHALVLMVWASTLPFSPALHTKPTFYTTLALFIFQSRTRPSPFLSSLHSCKHTDPRMKFSLAGAVYKTCFRQIIFLTLLCLVKPVLAKRRREWLVQGRRKGVFNVPLMLILWQTHIHAHSHAPTLKTQLQSYTHGGMRSSSRASSLLQ